MRVVLAIVFVIAAACGDNAAPGIQNPTRGSYQEWIEIPLHGTVCGNDSQYKIWANYSNTRDDLVVVLEPGGACWDYDSCTGKNGIRGAANVDGLPDDHYALAPFISPFLNRFDDTSPTRDWNMIYVPYCTGDVHTGNAVVTYQDPSGASAPVTFHHEGHADMLAVTAWIDSHFTHVPKLLVTGCSAGGVGSIVNYSMLRGGIHAADQGYLLDDSGPVFPDAASGFSTPMHQKIRAAWNLDSLAGELPPGFTFDDMGTLNSAVADAFPNDRLATTFFERDYNFSLYSYERFYNFPPKDQIMQMWAADTQLLVDLYNTRQNLYYFLPYWRSINSSHCTTVLNFVGSDIADTNTSLAQWVSDLVEDRPLRSMRASPVPGEDM
jgi:hypothetical protein